MWDSHFRTLSPRIMGEQLGANALGSGSAGAKGTEDGRRIVVFGMLTVVGWSDEGFHNLH